MSPKKSLKERVEKYCKCRQSMIALGEQTEIEQFFNSSISLVEQAVHISLNCLQFNLHPFIRNEVAFHYLVLLLTCFSNEKSLENYLWDVTMSYLISAYVIVDEIDSISFGDYYSKCKKGKLTEKLFSIVKESDLKIQSLNLEKLVDDISNLFHMCLK